MVIKKPLSSNDKPIFLTTGVMFDVTNEQASQRHLLRPSTTSRHGLMAYKFRVLLGLDF